jgi:hypothetical protein
MKFLDNEGVKDFILVLALGIGFLILVVVGQF